VTSGENASLTMTFQTTHRVPRRAFPLTRHYSVATTSSQANLLRSSSPGGSGRARVRRSMSSDSYGFQKDDAAVKTLTAGQRKAAEEKKGSRHADLIDSWDPTGLGDASESRRLRRPSDRARPLTESLLAMLSVASVSDRLYEF
jgi:hypothetical protein